MTPSLDGLHMLDLTRLLPGPVATMRLAELGADVLKIEAPGEGDYARTILQSDADRHSGTPSAFYRIVNRGKRCMTLDLKTDNGRASLIELARDTDSFRPSVMARLGVDYDVLRAMNLKLTSIVRSPASVPKIRSRRKRATISRISLMRACWISLHRAMVSLSRAAAMAAALTSR